jgi:hypothetical protein
MRSLQHQPLSSALQLAQLLSFFNNFNSTTTTFSWMA